MSRTKAVIVSLAAGLGFLASAARAGEPKPDAAAAGAQAAAQKTDVRAPVCSCTPAKSDHSGAKQGPSDADRQEIDRLLQLGG